MYSSYGLSSPESRNDMDSTSRSSTAENRSPPLPERPQPLTVADTVQELTQALNVTSTAAQPRLSASAKYVRCYQSHLFESPIPSAAASVAAARR